MSLNRRAAVGSSTKDMMLALMSMGAGRLEAGGDGLIFSVIKFPGFNFCLCTSLRISESTEHILVSYFSDNISKYYNCKSNA